MTRFDLSDDEVLLELLSESLAEADPVPAQAVAAAKAVAQLCDLDLELATLVADSLVDGDAVLLRRDLTIERLGELTDRLVSFATPELSVDVEFDADGATVMGIIAPPISVAVEVDTSEGSVTVRSDELGRFHVEVAPGRCRLRIHADTATVITPWITR